MSKSKAVPDSLAKINNDDMKEFIDAELTPDEQKEWQQSDTNLLEFHDFDKHQEFIGRYVRDYNYCPNNDGVVDWSAYVFKTPNNTEVLLSNVYQIKRAVTKHGTKLYKFIYLGEKRAANGNVKTFQIFTK